ncbi:MAG: RNase adapter RapZ [Rhodospirillaceae bacterium]|nr:MAG: RNase adapter RapZ [Rhodospirillaceae bacterium]
MKRQQKNPRVSKPSPRKKAAPARVIVVTGMSGAGKSSALHALEDVGFETVDNLPVALLRAVATASDGTQRPVAIGIDVRTRDFDAAQLLATRDAMRKRGLFDVSIVFLDCDNEVIGRRYTESRRPHPLADDRPVAVGVGIERRLLAPLREACDLMIDTSRLTPTDLQRILVGQYGGGHQRTMHVFLMSFSYRNGLPRDADVVFDVRFLKNPHYVAELRTQTGLDLGVGDYISRDPALATFLDRATAMLSPLLPLYANEGKSYLTIAIGCTGGQHRSVYVVERLRAWLSGQDVAFDVRHRDLPGSSARRSGQ